MPGSAFLSRHRSLKLLVLVILVVVWIVSLESYLSSSIRHVPLLSQIPRNTIEFNWTGRDDNPLTWTESSPPSTRFLAYLPHSGFHNQRIELENAIILSLLLNRTLVLPLARLGSHPLPYKPFDELFEHFGRSDKSWLSHCCTADTSANSTIKECRKYERYTHLSWQDLIDLHFVKETLGVNIIERWDFRNSWFKDVLGLNSNDIYWVKDSSAYEFRFHDGDTTSRSRGKYQTLVDIFSDLDKASHHHKLLHLGTLFGTSRLSLSLPANKKLRKNVRATVRYKNRLLESFAGRIVKELGGSNAFFGVHLRVGDGLFLERAMENAKLMRAIIWTRFYNLPQSELARANGTENVEDLIAVFNGHFPVLPIQKSPGRPITCPHSRLALENQPKLWRSLQNPLFIATDARDPHIHPALEPFRAIFPCILFLSDFGTVLEGLQAFRNPLDNSPLERFLLPFVDAMVVSQAAAIVGTPESTFSRYIEEVLWPLNHGRDIGSKNAK
ncbi:hypothetical protein FRC17_001846 [Serendipita sp. 399]|nr:hypothetical protein FRC17_001846 [Serendipita sp. 399]